MVGVGNNLGGREEGAKGERGEGGRKERGREGGERVKEREEEREEERERHLNIDTPDSGVCWRCSATHQIHLIRHTP